MTNIFNDIGGNKITLIKDGDKTIIACDAVISESHRMTAEATQYEIEDGSDIHDHIIKRGKLLTIEGIVSDDPITILQTGMLDRTIAAITPSFINSKLSYGLSEDKGKPSKEAFDQFEQIYDNKLIVTIITGLKEYNNMVMEELDISRSSKTIRSLNFTASFRQLNLVNAVFISTPATYQTTELGAQPKENVGKLNSKSLPGTDNRGFIATVYDWATNVF